MQNRLRKTIAKKGNAVGTFLSISNTQIIEAISSSGLDFICTGKTAQKQYFRLLQNGY